jgi:hypothetical protein
VYLGEGHFGKGFPPTATPQVHEQKMEKSYQNEHGKSSEKFMMTQIEQNKSLAIRLAKEGWGTQANWEKTWDELMANDVLHHFNSDPIV